VSSTGNDQASRQLSEVRGAQAADNLKNTDPGNSAKIQKSAREFEAVLLSHWLEQAEQSFASVPGSDQDPMPILAETSFTLCDAGSRQRFDWRPWRARDRGHGGQTPGGPGCSQGSR